ncbi:hypothetical protein [uncultured Roseibium sp.]|uniref:hypothetical protein n=1 Tax=uncultured Roseibium sp. TaxID=1936171 RepID=UPI002612868D|nr:hypothetical protein [uncultured Roseibium sp.]
MYADILEATVLNNTRYEKDPNRCLAYHVLDDTRAPLSQEQVAVEWSASGKGDDAQAIRVRRSPMRVCAGGDSWINVVIEVSRYLGYNKTFFDILEGYYQTASSAWPGHSFDDMISEKPFRVHVDTGVYDYLVFSGGGNEVLGGVALTKILKDRSAALGSDQPEDFLQMDRLEAILEKLKDGYVEVAEYLRKRAPRTQLLVHGYDYPVAQSDGPWFGRPFVKRNFRFEADKELITGILHYLVDRFYGFLQEVDDQYPNVTLVDIRNVVRGRWTDEFHPDLDASKDIAGFYRNVIDGYPIV